MITGLDHVQLAMPAGEEDIARAFYSNVLGMEEIAKPPHLAVNGGCWFKSGSANIHLGVDAAFVPALQAHPAVLVSDLDTMREHMARHGVEFADGKPLDGYKRGDIHDPFGNKIELMEKL